MSKQDDLKHDMSLSERLDELGMDLMATGFYFVSLYQNGKEPSKAMEQQYAALQSEFKKLQATYMALQKLGRIDKNHSMSTDTFDRKVLDKIKEKQSALGSIVAQRPK